MTNDIASATITGRVGQKELHRNGVSRLRLRIATKMYSRDGRTHYTNWFTVLCFGARAEKIADHIEVGQHLLIQAEIQSQDDRVEFVIRDGCKWRITANAPLNGDEEEEELDAELEY